MKSIQIVQKYLNNLWIKIALGLILFGWGPLLGIILLAALGLWPDPNPNPIGPGLLFFFSFWPAIICLAIGIRQVRRKQMIAPDANQERGWRA